jgi:ergothioneine biosynthesis protein EgtB
MTEFDGSGLDGAALRSAGKELLSLALIEARNHTLRWAAALEEHAGGDGGRLVASELLATAASEIDPPLWTLAHIAWFQERWIARNVQRARGEAADPAQPRLASIVPDADRWYDAAEVDRAHRHALVASGEGLDLAAVRTYLVDSLETTLELLAAIGNEDDASLYFHRLALFHEEMHGEAFAVLAQTLGLGIAIVPRVSVLAPRPPLLIPATRWLLGASGAGFAFDNERQAHPVDIPEFEIDAQPVTWAQYGEFVEDGGYDNPSHWSADGWAWCEQQARRVPRYVHQMRQGVLQQRFGRLMRVPMPQPAMHVSWHEASAWCRWAGRRLPAEVEWEAAAQSYSRGFAWGSVWEWTASTLRPYPGFSADPWVQYSQPHFSQTKVLRGASFATRQRLRSTKFRRFAPADRDELFCGFRSCAV